jgi:hypothetical protein
MSKRSKKTEYMLFCSRCNMPQPIPKYILQTYIKVGVSGVYCKNCENKTVLPDYLIKIAQDL